MKLDKLFERIVDDYAKKYTIYPCSSQHDPYCYISRKVIFIPIDRWFDPDMRDIFDLVHEIGHLETNTEDMKFYEKEYLATVWAAKYCKEHNIPVSKRTQRDYQRHINAYANRCKYVHIDVNVNWD